MSKDQNLAEENFELINAIRILRENLKTDEEFRQVWENEIATSVMDSFNKLWGNEGMSVIAKEGAKDFLRKLMKK